MSLEFLESFDKYGTTTSNIDAMWSGTSTGTLSATGGRSGSARYWSTTGSVGITKTHPARASSTYGLACNLGSLAFGGEELFKVKDGATVHLVVDVTTAGNVEVCRAANAIGGGGTLLASYAAGITTGTWHYYELQFTIDDTNGVANLFIDGVLRISFTGDTRNGGNATADRINLAIFNAGPNKYDDVYICDGITAGDQLGPVHVEYQTASGAGATTQWTPSTGANYQNIDEDGSNGDTDYNSTNVSGNKDTFQIANFSNAGTVKGLQIPGLFRLDDIGTRNMNVVLGLATDHNSADLAVSSQTYAFKAACWTTNPETGNPFTIAEINGMEAGYKLAS